VHHRSSSGLTITKKTLFARRRFCHQTRQPPSSGLALSRCVIRVPLAPSSWSPPPDDWYPFHDIELVESPESPPPCPIIDPKDRAPVADRTTNDNQNTTSTNNNNSTGSVNNNCDRRDACAVGVPEQHQHQQHQQQPEADMIMDCGALEPGVGPLHHAHHHHHHHHHHHPYLLGESAAAVTTATTAAGHFNVLSFETYKGGVASSTGGHVGNGGHGTGNSACHSPAQGNAGTDLNTPVTTTADVPSFFGPSTVVEPPLITGTHPYL